MASCNQKIIKVIEKGTDQLQRNSINSDSLKVLPSPSV